MEEGKANNNSIMEENPSNNDGADVNNGNNNDITNDGRGCADGRRRPFTDLSQVDADLALARTLQEQERAYVMIRNGNGYGSWDAGSYGHGDEDDDDFDDPSEEEYDGSDVEEDNNEEEDDDDDAFDVHEHNESGEDENQNVDIDPSAYSSDEAYARALQDAEEREMAARLLAMAGINDMVVGEDEDEDEEGHGENAQDAWEEIDPDELSYEELIALGEVVGTESRGLSADTIASLPSTNYKSQSTQDGINGINDSCVICRLDYEDGETLTVLSCKHSYHGECINNWLRINKVCPVCSAEVSTSGTVSSI